MKLQYPWVGEKYLKDLNLPVTHLRFSIQDREHYESKDSPTKINFQHPWDCWKGVDISYIIQDLRLKYTLKVIGSRGKTIWYLPANSADIAQVLQIPTGHALKIIKYNIEKTLSEELQRLNNEIEIQNIISAIGFAPRASGVIGVINHLDNEVEWFDHTIYYPAGSFFLSVIVEHIIVQPFPEGLVWLDGDDNLHGPGIDKFIEKCLEINIKPYDLCLGNVLFNGDSIKVVDFHKWAKM